MIRCVRLWTGDDGLSHFSVGHVVVSPGRNGDEVSDGTAVSRTSFQETGPGGSLAAHTAPKRQLVVTLSGTPTVTTPDGKSIRLGPGDVMLAEDTTGSGHSWHLDEGGQPWQRMYVVLDDDAEIPFVADDAQPSQKARKDCHSVDSDRSRHPAPRPGPRRDE